MYGACSNAVAQEYGFRGDGGYNIVRETDEAVARQCTGQRPIQLANGPGRLKPERAATNAQTPHPVTQPDAPPIEAPPASYQRKQIETAAVRRPSVVVRTNTTNAGLPTPREGRVPKLPPSAVSNAPDYLVFPPFYYLLALAMVR